MHPRRPVLKVAYFLHRSLVVGVLSLLSCETNVDVQPSVERKHLVGEKPPPHFTGTWVTWYANGGKACEDSYRNGKRHGKWRHWRPNGSRGYEGAYKDGLSNGKWTWWHENGQVKRESHYRLGRRHDASTRRDEEGKIVSVKRYQSGGALLWTDHYEDGKFAFCEAVPTFEERRGEVQKRVAQIRIGMTRSKVEKIFKQRDGGINGSSSTRYYEGAEVMVEVPYDRTGGAWSPQNRVNGPVIVYRSHQAFD